MHTAVGVWEEHAATVPPRLTWERGGRSTVVYLGLGAAFFTAGAGGLGSATAVADTRRPPARRGVRGALAQCEEDRRRRADVGHCGGDGASAAGEAGGRRHNTLVRNGL